MKHSKSRRIASRISSATLLVVALALSAFLIFTMQFRRKTPGGREQCRHAPSWEPWMFCYIFEIDNQSYENITENCKGYIHSTFALAQLDMYASLKLLSEDFPWFNQFNWTADINNPAMNVLTRIGVLYMEGGVLMRSDINCTAAAMAYHMNKQRSIIIGNEGSFVIAPPESMFFSSMMVPFMDAATLKLFQTLTPNDIIRNVIMTAYEQYPCKNQVTIVDEIHGNVSNQVYMRAKFHHMSFSKLFGSYMHAILIMLLFLANVFIFAFVIKVVLSDNSENSDTEKQDPESDNNKQTEVEFYKNT